MLARAYRNTNAERQATFKATVKPVDRLWLSNIVGRDLFKGIAQEDF